MTTQRLTLNGKSYVVVPRDEYERLTVLAKAGELPPLPKPDSEGNYPAVTYARASISRSVIRDRAKLGLTQRELARRAGIRFETLCRIESGRHTPTVASIEKLDQALKKAEKAGGKGHRAGAKARRAGG